MRQYSFPTSTTASRILHVVEVAVAAYSCAVGIRSAVFVVHIVRAEMKPVAVTDPSSIVLVE